MHEAQCDALGNKKPCLHVADGVINLVAGVGIEPTTSRLWALISTTELTCDIMVRMTGVEPARIDRQNLNLMRLPISPHPQNLIARFY